MFVLPGKEPRLKEERAVFPAAKRCPPTIPLILWSYAESTSRLQVDWGEISTCKICYMWPVLMRLTVVLFPFSAYRVSVYRGYRRLSS